MTLSIWRYSHLALAVVSSVFILVAALTGTALAIEPIQKASVAPSDAIATSEVSLAELIPIVQEAFLEVVSIQVDEYQHVVVSAIDFEGEFGDYYINPKSGEILGAPEDKNAFFEFCTNLHRSLFLKTTGRLLVGITSFLLLLIAASGTVLVVKRQNGIQHFFGKIIKATPYQYAHILLGRASLLPIVIITLTGVILSAVRFELFSTEEIAPIIELNELATEPSLSVGDFPLFQKITTNNVQSVELPFSEDVEDFYIVSTKNAELHVNQYTGDVVKEIPHSLQNTATYWSTFLHTGRGSVSWSIILGLASLGIHYFIWSGFKMTFARRSARVSSNCTPAEAEYVVLVGSETGSTIQFAKAFCTALESIGKKVHFGELNSYQKYNSMKHLVVFTATYGNGDAPANANKFIHQLNKVEQAQPFQYAVVGFGSLAYSNFCHFALETDEALAAKNIRALDIYTINNKSWESFIQWVNLWGSTEGLELTVPTKNPSETEKRKVELFEVVYKTEESDMIDDTFLIRLKTTKRRFTSGDLLAIFPSESSHERLYSIAKDTSGHILLSVKVHAFGLCSNYLKNLSVGDHIEGAIVANPDFHFSKKAPKTIMIGTGTGIAPYLGMIANSCKSAELELYWGGRTRDSFALYQEFLKPYLDQQKVEKIHLALSRSNLKPVYVQHLIAQDSKEIASTLKDGGIIMICGSVQMQSEVIQTLNTICHTQLNLPLSTFQNKGQLLMDCY